MSEAHSENVTAFIDDGRFIVRANGDRLDLSPGQAVALKNFLGQLQEKYVDSEVVADV